MNYTVIGFKNVDFTSKQGRQITGTRLYLTYEDQYTFGVACLDVFIRNTIDYVPAIGDTVMLLYNRFGSVENIQVIAG